MNATSRRTVHLACALISSASLVACSGTSSKPSIHASAKVAGATAAERNHNAAMPAAYHEFQVFGEKTVYLSHYPMFASIHGYQVIVEATLSGDGIDATKTLHDYQHSHPDIGISLSPSQRNALHVRQREDWVLPVEVVVGGRFNGDMWVPTATTTADPTGRHYLATNITVEVTKIVQFQIFYPDTDRAPALT